MEYAFDFYESWVRFGDKIESDEERRQEMSKNKPFETFQFRVKWMEFAATLHPEEETAFKWAVIIYGLTSEEPTRLHGKSLEYFNSEVRPDIDKQHKRMRNRKL